MKEIIKGKIYNTETATLIADDHYWDGHNYTKCGRNSYLYKTKKNNYFTHTTTQWIGERDTIMPITKDEALELWDCLPEKRCEYKNAFNIEPIEA